MLSISDEERKMLLPRKGANLGRKPLHITEQMIKDAEVLSGRGLTYAQIAHYFGIHETTFYRKIEEFPALGEALMKGKSKTISQVAGKLIELIKGGSVPAAIFYLKTQAGWKDLDGNSKDYNEASEVQEKKKLTTGTKDPNEAAKVYQQIMLKGKK